MECAVLVVMMRLFFEMQHHVRSAIAVIVLQAHVRHSERVPQQRDHKQENGWRFAHGRNLAETRRTVELRRRFGDTEMLLIVTKYAITSLVIVLVSELAKRSDKVGALVASLPLVTVMVMIWLYVENQEVEKVARHAYYTFWYVLPTLPMFLLTPALLYRGVNFWLALGAGVLLTLVCFVAVAVIANYFRVKLLPDWRAAAPDVMLQL